MKAWLGSLKLPHVFTLLFAVTTGVSLASWFVPSGSFERLETQFQDYDTMTKISIKLEELRRLVTGTKNE